MMRLLPLNFAMSLAVLFAMFLAFGFVLPQPAHATVAVAAEAIDSPSSKETATDALAVVVDKARKLELAEDAETVFVANPDIADVQVISPTSIMVYGKRAGETTVTASKKDGSIIIQRRILVEEDVSKLKNVLRQMLPKIQALPVPGGIVLEGEAGSSLEAADAQRIASKFLSRDKDEVINRLKVSGSEQVQLRVRIAEVSKNVNKVFGFNWDAFSIMGNLTLGLQQGAAFFDSATNGFTRVGGNGAMFGGYNSGAGIRVNSLIDALAEDGLVSILAEPNLTAKSGETATFLSGGEFPVPVPQQNGAVTVIFKPYGVSLSFTPTVIGRDRISIQVRPEVSELTTVGSITLSNVTIPALLTRRAETTVELGSGQSFAIGGLIRSTQNNDIRKFPFLGDLPVLGTLFRSTQFRNNQSELVILVTPYIVKPSSQPLATPVDGYAPPNDLERIIGGQQHSENVENAPLSAGQSLEGPVGFVMDAP